MDSQEKEISYETTNSYSTLNTLTSDTKNVWFVCHGMGYLSRYFLKYFEDLNSEENYIIAPQAQSKYYVKPNSKHVGASWLTKENTLKETDNVMRYFDAILESENIPCEKHLIVLGYSQGVSVALRYIAKTKLQCQQIALLSGGIPHELQPEHFDFLESTTKVSLIYGTNDAYLDDARILKETEKAAHLFGNLNLKVIPFAGVHEVKKELIHNLIK